MLTWGSSLDDAVADEPPLPANPAGDGDALARFRDDRDLESHVRAVLASRAHDADYAFEEIDLDGHLHHDLRKAAWRPDDATDEPVRFRQHGIEVRADRDEAPRSHLLLRGAAGLQRPHARCDVLPFRLVAERHLAARRDLDLLADLDAALHQAPSEDAADHLLRHDPRLVHVEGARDIHLRGLRFLVGRGRDALLDHHQQHVQVDVVVRAHRDDRRALCDGPLHERLDLAVVLLRLLRVDDVDLILDDHDLVDADDPERHQVLLRLRLRAILVRRDHEEGAVHDRRAAEHRRHERLVAGRVDEGHDPLQLRLHVVDLARVRVRVTRWLLTLRTLVDRHVRVAEADRDAPLDLLRVAVRPLPREPFRERRLPMVDVAADADVDLRLARDLHRACSCHASSTDFGPRWTIRRFSCRISGLTVFPRTVFFLRIPGRTGWKPTPPLTRRRFRRGPGRSGRIGKPSLSLPPVIWSL